jgi:hypothetical protein
MNILDIAELLSTPKEDLDVDFAFNPPLTPWV